MRTVVTDYHHEDGAWWATSEDVPGFSVVATSLFELRELVREGLAFYLDGEELDIRESVVSDVEPTVTAIWGVSTQSSANPGVLGTISLGAARLRGYSHTHGASTATADVSLSCP